jgi:hypothetical protein
MQMCLDVMRVHHIGATLAEESRQAQDSPCHPGWPWQAIDGYSGGDEARRQYAGVLEAHDTRVHTRAIGMRDEIENDTFQSADVE